MEYANEGDLFTLIEKKWKNKKPFKEKEIIEIMSQINNALVFLHSKKIVHWDIKTLNVFVKDNKILLGDFGASKEN